jgi:hypothetical protein
MCKDIQSERQGFGEGGKEEKIKTHFQLATEAVTFKLSSSHILDSLSYLSGLILSTSPSPSWWSSFMSPG